MKKELNECGCPQFEYYMPSWDTHSEACEKLQVLVHKLLHKTKTEKEILSETMQWGYDDVWDDDEGCV